MKRGKKLLDLLAGVVRSVGDLGPCITVAEELSCESATRSDGIDDS